MKTIHVTVDRAHMRALAIAITLMHGIAKLNAALK